MRAASAFCFGLVFGLGLVISGMSDPARVIGFLDITGQWNPSLILVMAGGIAAAAPAFYLARRRKTGGKLSALGEPIAIPENKIIDGRLLAGAAIFGLGWGLAGICPGPGLVLLGYGAPGAIIFVIALVAGFRLVDWFTRRPQNLGQQHRAPT